MADARLPALADGVYGEELERRIDEAAGSIRDRLAESSINQAPRLGFVLGRPVGGLVVAGVDPAVPRVGSAVGGGRGALVAG